MEKHAGARVTGAGRGPGPWPVALVVAAVGMAMFPDDAWAWGPGLHVAQGSFILENLSLIKPQVASIIGGYPLDYIYGCISADIFIGKGYRRRPDHCHNWSVGMKVLDSSRTYSTKAYAYGYLTHLAADIIAHNYFVPRLLASNPASNGLGHVYWEFRADRFIKKKYWTLASKVVSMHNQDNDTLIKQVMKRGKFRFGAKKLMYKRAVRLSDLMVWREYVESARAQKRRITRRQVSTLNNYAINMIIDLLCKGESSICLDFDPVGTDNTVKARQFRRAGRRARKTSDIDAAFAVSGRIISVRHVDHHSERL